MQNVAKALEFAKSSYSDTFVDIFLTGSEPEFTLENLIVNIQKETAGNNHFPKLGKYFVARFCFAFQWTFHFYCDADF